ncbi:copper resistance CopC/CopD family protein [Streptomyces aidingensis]|uniref:Copper transport protein n=1 Tax=Streptomyces aidingensis TaxID=910347 RepID=A0A1I1QMT6_9ACTN|nr:copper resistance protein CopC [Streptomyces aidingensis]SFD20593.1 copper transport protein [Streptomyces aidingensis]
MRSLATAPRLLATALAAVALLLLGAPSAAAHASLSGSDPEDGAVVPQAPAEVRLTFTEEVAVSAESVRVLDPDGNRADPGAAPGRVPGEGFTYAVPLLDGLGDGTYTVVWQVVSADSHPISGAFTFSIGAASERAAEVTVPEPGGGTVGLLYDTARYAAYTGFLLLLGGSVFVLACWPAAARVRVVQRLVVTGWSILTAATIALLWLRHPYTTGGGPADAASLSGLQAVLETKTGTALASRLILLAAAGLFIAVLFGTYARLNSAGTGAPGRGDEKGDATAARRRDLRFGLVAGGGILAIGIAATWSLSEHASTGPQRALAVPADLLHLLAVAVWLGGLATLLLLLRRTRPVPGEAVRRFSALAFGSVLVLAATGLYQSWRQVRSWEGLTGTEYGTLLLLKTGLVALLLAVAWLSRRWTARLADGSRPAQPDPDTEPADADPDGDADGDADAGGGGGAVAVTPERAAQLARQQAAVREARRRKVLAADPVRAGLRRSVRTEALIAVVVLAVTTVLTGTAPARTETAGPDGNPPSAAGPAGDSPAAGLSLSYWAYFDTGGPDGAGNARIELDSAAAGDNGLLVAFTDESGEPLRVAEVRAAFTLPAEEVGPLRHAAERSAEAGPETWTVEELVLPRPGEWELDLTIRTSEIDQVTVTLTFPLG